jgi:hypothetical protein
MEDPKVEWSCRLVDSDPLSDVDTVGMPAGSLRLRLSVFLPHF